MKNEWDKLYVALAEVQDEIEELLPELPQSKNFTQRSNNLKRKWALTQKLANDLNEMIMPANPIPVNSPFDHVDFVTTWQMWKDYLQEQHHITMRSRMEVCGLKRLAEISNTEYMSAIRILEFAMSGGYKGFFRIDEKSQSRPITETTETINY
jgi:hypothetical protein